MRLFRTLFNLAALPLIVAKDIALAIPKSSCGQDPFEDTKAKCDDLDYSISEKL